MRLRHIEVFQAVLQAGSVSGAARLLNVSQPNVSRVLNHAEQQLGFNLFDRTPQGLVITPEGRRLMPEVEALFSHIQAIGFLAEQLRQGEGQHVRIGSAHALGHSVMAPVLVDFHRKTPAGSVELVTGHFNTLCQDLLQYKMDFALAFGEQVSAELVSETLYAANMVALLPLDFSVEGPVTLEWLSENNLLMLQQQDPLGQVLNRVLREQGLTPQASLHIKTYSVIADMVLAGGGVGVVDTFTAQRYLHQLKIVPVVDSLPFEVILLSRRDQPQSQVGLALQQLIRHKLWELSDKPLG
ncbi:LysR family transcriptional regulator [Rouxiella badensis]|jgi:DNA-binding transcriptional LysR family regulator|uniref:LysR family transcriptional regulator n=1 Tax=Rouxiella badensis TaxID=1646377 RepID=A0A1X0WGI7_9GAMM|nr:LysR family transcriptional regulator [Rouxiella badensis]ORJ25916.1 LysR family transcriptional regulator [Rouxiella badensis]WAT04328.1 LysR family transcriptional regulator [Rouxiella badensis]